MIVAHRSRVAVEVHRHDRPGAVGDGRLGGSRVDAEGVRVDVDEDRSRADDGDRVRRRRERERRDDHLVARRMPIASSARCSADVPELTATQCRSPTSGANSCSNAATSGPWASIPRAHHVDDCGDLVLADQRACGRDEGCVSHVAAPSGRRVRLLGRSLPWPSTATVHPVVAAGRRPCRPTRSDAPATRPPARTRGRR